MVFLTKKKKLSMPQNPKTPYLTMKKQKRGRKKSVKRYVKINQISLLQFSIVKVSAELPELGVDFEEVGLRGLVLLDK